MLPAAFGKRSRRKLFGIILGGALALALVLYFVASKPDSSDSASRAGHTAAPTGKVGVPARLKIPKAKVDAPVERVGLTPEGAMDIPKDPSNTAWYDRGPRPGEVGSSVIDGHYDRQGGAPAVFSDLRALHPGDKLTVEDGSGLKITFVVRELRTYDPNADAATVFRSSDGRSHLNLITCTGVWDTAQQTYSNRLVVFADKETPF